MNTSNEKRMKHSRPNRLRPGFSVPAGAMASVSVLWLAGVLGSGNVQAQTVVVPRVVVPQRAATIPAVTVNAQAAIVPRVALTAPVVPTAPDNSLPIGDANIGTATNPVYVPTVVSGNFGAYTVDQVNNIATITETSNTGILSWNSFDIGAKSTVNIKQPGSTSVLLNRISGSLNQTLIDGALNANGNVYFYNPNGFIFGKSALVNVNTLLATSLNLDNKLVVQGILSPSVSAPFAADPALTSAPGDILVDGDSSAHATLNASKGGKIILFAPNVTNNGVVTAPDGQVILAGGGKVYLSAPTDTTMRGFYVEVDSTSLPTGTNTSVTNNGTIAVGRGNATLVGLAVNQNNTITAQTSVNLNGTIYLQAADGGASEGVGSAPHPTINGTLTLGSGSVTRIDIADDGTTSVPSDNNPFKPSVVSLKGQTINLNGQIVATGGQVNVDARVNPLAKQGDQAVADASLINLAPGSSIDVAGDKNVVLPMSSNVVSIQLLSELANNVALRDSTLRGKTLNFDIRKPTTIADISADLAKVPYTVGQLAATGGSVNISSLGAIVQQSGSKINVSGGQVNFAAGYVNTSKLVSGGALFSDATAPLNRSYSGFVNLPDGRWDYEPAYFDGKSAGSITLNAPQIALLGGKDSSKDNLSFVGTTQIGTYQRDVGASNRPSGGRLVIGTSPGSFNDQSVSTATLQFGYLGDLTLNNNGTMPVLTDFAGALASNRIDLNVDALNAGGFTQLAAYATGKITVAGNIALGAGGGLSLTSIGNISFTGGVNIPGGSVSAKTAHTIMVDPNSSFDLAGTWRNDTLITNPSRDVNGNPTGDIVMQGGSLALDANHVVIDDNVTVDVSGGGWLAAKRTLSKGNGGKVSLVADSQINITDKFASLEIGNNLSLESYSLSKGGSLVLQTNNVQIGGILAAADPTQDPALRPLLLPSDFFSQGGFSSFAINGMSSLTVSPGSHVTATAQNWIFNNFWRNAASGKMTDAAAPGTLNLVGPQSGRQPVSLTLRSVKLDPLITKATGTVFVGASSTIQTDPNATVTLEAGTLIDVEGTINAPAGNINLAFSGLNSDPAKGIWLGADAHLFARGTTSMMYTGPNGMTTGEVLGGGTVTIGGGYSGADSHSDSGYLLVEQQTQTGVQGGASIDVSGAVSGPVTLSGQRNRNGPVTVASAGGNISIDEVAGISFSGSLLGMAGNSTQQGGSLSINLAHAASGTVFPANLPGIINIIDGPVTNYLPTGLAPGQSITGFPYEALISTGSFGAGGFDSLSFKSNVINLASSTGSFNLTAASSLYLDAPVLSVSTVNGASTPLSSVQLTSPYVQLGSDNYQVYQNNPSANVLHNPNNNYFSFNPQYLNNAATDGSATLNVNATTIDLIGSTVVQGVQNTNLNATQDIRLVGVSKSNLASGPASSNTATPLNLLMPTGEFSVAGNLTLTSAQVYPTTLSSFALDVVGANSNLNFVSNGNKPYAPLSAAGTLFGFAQNITQGGTVVAPFGTIDLVAGTQINYKSGSTTSVAGSGVIPFGMVINGRDWAYDFGAGNEVLFELNPSTNGNLPQTSLPQKLIISSAPTINTEGGATLNLSGGGQLYAYEFTAGSYGTADVLKNNVPGSQTKIFAIMPGYGDAVAPRDFQYGHDGGLRPGQSVYLSGIAGLAAGNYVLLPAHYALLPGAMAISVTSTGRDTTLAQNMVNLDGSYSVSGNADVLGKGDSRSRTVTVTPGGVVRKESQYQEYSLTSYFSAAALTAGVTAPQLPIDGGHLVFNASNTLALAGQVELAADKGGSNGIVDISAPAIDVVDDATQIVAPNTLKILASDLTALSADSLLLGGIRQTNGSSTTVQVGAQSIMIDNSNGHPLSGSEIILAAQNSVTLSAGAVIQATGSKVHTSNSLTIQDIDANGQPAGTDGALVRVSTGSAVAIGRIAPTGAQGTLTIGQGATVAATGSAYLDATLNTTNNGQLNLASGAALGLGAPRISLGDAIPGSVSGLQFNTAALANLNNLSALTLTSYSIVDLYGNVNLGSASMNNLTLNSSGFQGNYVSGAPGNVVLAAQNVQFGGDNKFVTAGPVATTGSAGTFSVNAQNILIGQGDVAVHGYANNTLTASNQIIGLGTGTFTVANNPNTLADPTQAANLNLVAGNITANSGANLSIAAQNTLTIAQYPGAPNVTVASLQLGGTLQFAANTIQSSGNISLPSGSISMVAAEGINLTGGTLSAAGSSKVFGSTTAFANAGDITLNGGAGTVTIAAPVTLDVSSVGASAGVLNISASGVNLDSAATLKGGANLSQAQGSFALDVGQLATTTQLDQLATKLTLSGFNAAQNYRVRNGDVRLDAGNTLAAQQVNISTDNGNLTIAGTIDASGPSGGTIGLFASQTMTGGGSGNVNLLAGSVLNALANKPATSTTQSTAGSIGTGGNVTVGTASADGGMPTDLNGGSTINFASGALINVSGYSTEANGNANGTVTFRAPQIYGGHDVAILGLNGTFSEAGFNGTAGGNKLTTVEGYKVYTAAAISSAADHSNGDGTWSNLQAATTAGAVPTSGVLYKDAQTFGNGVAAAALASRSTSGLALTMSPGIEVRSIAANDATGATGDLTVSVNEGTSKQQNRGWNLDTWRFKNAPVNLTLRASGNLIINGSISDGFVKPKASAAMPDWALDKQNSGSFRLIGGADYSAANPLAVISSSSSGDVSINFVNTSTSNSNDAPVALVRTGTGSIDVAAGRDVVLGSVVPDDPIMTLSASIYTAGKQTSYDGSLGSFTAPANVINSQYTNAPGAISSAQFAEDGGAISILAQRSVVGAAQQQLVNNWLFHQGATTVDQNGNTAFSTFDTGTANTAWWARPDYFDQGIATMAGGKVSVVAVTGNLMDVSAGTASNAFMPGSAPGALVERGGGDLFVKAGGDILGGSFYVQKGQGTITAGGSISSGSIPNGSTPNGNIAYTNTILALGDALLNVTARGNLNVEAVYNPTIAVQSTFNSGISVITDNLTPGKAQANAQFSNFSTYSANSSVNLVATTGDVLLTNNSGTGQAVSALGTNFIPLQNMDSIGSDLSYDQLYTYAPPNLNVTALNGSITSIGGFSMAGSAKGELNMLASNSVNITGTGRVGLVMLDVAPANFSLYSAPRYLDMSQANDFGVLTGLDLTSKIAAHTPDGLHSGDTQPVRIVAENGDINGDGSSYPSPSLWLPKMAEITAGHNIQNLGFVIQNNAATDVTTLTAGNNFTDSSTLIGTGSNIQHYVDGPGRIDFNVGHTFDLGNSGGVFTRGNLFNPFQNFGGAAINIQAGTVYADYVNFSKNFVDVTKLSSADQAALVAFVNQADSGSVTTAKAAWAVLEAMPVEQQASFLNQIKPDLNAIFFTDLVASSKISGLSQFDKTIATLFPKINPAGGEINVFASELETYQGGSINMFTPGGSIYAGLPNLPTYLTKTASQLGIFTIAGGAIGGLVKTNFEVDQGRVFTLGGGDISLVSQFGDLSAGKGTKTASSAPPPLLIVHLDGSTTYDVSGSISGSGIGTLKTDPSVPDGSVYVIAPRGTFDAGDAGVRSSGSVEVNALVVLNAGNIVAAGSVSGVPTVESINIGGGLSNTTPNVGDIAKSLSNPNQDANKNDTTLSVDVLGYGSDKDSDDDEKKKQKKI
ncbi:filamentous hemagglutinin [Oxalobacteraceae bacterium GrIS 2.11]